MQDTLLNTNLTALITSNKELRETLQILYTNNIRYGLYAGCYVSLVTSSRTPTDIDLLLADEDLEKTRQLFPNGVYKDKPFAKFLYTDASESIEFMANGDVNSQGHTYIFRLTENAYAHSVEYDIQGTHIRLLNAADTILLKAMLQRGINEGKHDLEDIQALLKKVTIDKEYMTDRLKESGAEDIRVIDLLNKFDLI